MTLEQLNAALGAHGWFAEWASENDDDVSIKFIRPERGQVFYFDPSNKDDNNPWDNEGAVHGFTGAIEDKNVESALLALCKEFQ